MLGFHEKWVGWILKCITTVSYSVLINGESHGSITPSRGLRQGDPLLSYLFLLCSEAFSAMTVEANNNQRLSGISICKGARISPICSLQTIVYYFVRQKGKRAKH